MTEETRLPATLGYFDAGVRVSCGSRAGLGAIVGASTTVELAGFSLGLAGRVGGRTVRFDGPDPVLDPARSRRDTRTEAGLSLTLPLSRALAIVGEDEGFEQDSTTRLYRYGNHAVTVGLRLAL